MSDEATRTALAVVFQGLAGDPDKIERAATIFEAGRPLLDELGKLKDENYRRGLQANLSDLVNAAIKAIASGQG